MTIEVSDERRYHNYREPTHWHCDDDETEKPFESQDNAIEKALHKYRDDEWPSVITIYGYARLKVVKVEIDRDELYSLIMDYCADDLDYGKTHDVGDAPELLKETFDDFITDFCDWYQPYFFDCVCELDVYVGPWAKERFQCE
jgi:hypothetical protein